jgi:F-type H+-transporting ATPase subunit epsilon
MRTIHLDIVTPDGSSFSGDVESIVIPAWEGQLGILPGREPLVAALKAGELRYRKDGKDELVAISGGFAQVDPKKVVVLAETAELASQIDIARAKAKLEQKQIELKGTAIISEEMSAAIQASLLKELIRIRVAEKGKRS